MALSLRGVPFESGDKNYLKKDQAPECNDRPMSQEFLFQFLTT